MSTAMNWNRLFSFLVVICLSSLPIQGWTQEPTPQERQVLKRIKTNIDRAGKQFIANKLDESQEFIEAAMKDVEAVTSGARKELIEAIQPDFARLQKAHQLLTEKGQKLSQLAPLPQPRDPNMGSVSFRNDVAPILVAKCGNCHVSRNRGNFSAASYQALDASTTIARGLPQDSRLIEVIENGEMPKGGLTIEPKELEILKSWIKAGAKYDGENPQQPLNQFVEAAPRRTRLTEPAKPTGNETVSFGQHVAPILIEHCGQCHIDSNNPRGNLNLATFRGLLAGGDSGAIIQPGKSADSFLFNRIELGEMPPDRKLDSKLIGIIGKWIDEGAKFDGGDVRMDVKMIAAKAKANSQSHDELVQARAEKAEQTWDLVMSGYEPKKITSENFLVVGTDNESRLTDVSKLAESLVPKIQSTLKSSNSDPLVKGNVSLFVFSKRYDFSEFGKMIEESEFPKTLTTKWGFDSIDAYLAMLATRNREVSELKVQLARQIAALHIASLSPDIPRWFADGNGYWVAKKIFPREEETKIWLIQAQSAAASMNRPDDFIQSRLTPESTALVGYLFVQNLRSDGKRFNRLMSSLRDGDSFENAFQATYGTSPDQMVRKNK